MSVIEKIRNDREELARVVVKHKGIRKLVEELYADKAHFIYELLQNAEDAKASKVLFDLKEDKLIFSHDGKRPFEEKDVWGITDLGEGTKADDQNSIGKFGIGFKAVFSYTESPRIWSPEYSFEIKELFLPYELERRPELDEKTRFEFPFNNPKKPKSEAYTEIVYGLENLPGKTLLFLKNIRKIRWRAMDGLSGTIEKQSIEKVKIIKRIRNSEKIEDQTFLVFSKKVEAYPEQSVSVAYELDELPFKNEGCEGVAATYKISPAKKGTVSIFFLLAKETSNLRFHLHAPFVCGPDRSSVKDLVANDGLFKDLANLVSSSLRKIRDEELLTGDFLDVLPNNEDDLPSANYESIRSGIIHEMRNNRLVPVLDGGHESAKKLVRCGKRLQDLLELRDLPYVLGDPDKSFSWAVSGKKGTRRHQMLDSLEIRQIKFNHFFDFLVKSASVDLHSEPKNHIFTEWIKTKDHSWHRRFYYLLEDKASNQSFVFSSLFDYTGPKFSSLSGMLLARLKTGDYRQGKGCYFATKIVSDEALFPQVDPRTYEVELEDQQENLAEKFLQRIGVQEAGEKECVEQILKDYYEESINDLEFEKHIEHLRRFADLLKKEKGKKSIALFQNSKIALTAAGTWVKPSKAFSSHKRPQIKRYFELFDDDKRMIEISSQYLSTESHKKILDFFVEIGVRDNLSIESASIRENPERKRDLRKRTVHACTCDFKIKRLKKFMKYIDEPEAKIVWKLISGTKEHWWTAFDLANNSSPGESFPSQLAQSLRDSAWVPQGAGVFVKPSEASSGKLPGGFPFDKEWKWLEVLEFGKELPEDEREELQEIEKAKALGVGPESLRFTRDYESLDEGDRRKCDEFLQKMKNKNSTRPPRGFNSPGDRERRSEKIKERVSEAIGRTTKIKPRAVSVGREDVKDEAKPYLEANYTNPDGKMLCQICKDELPFKVKGKYYFETVEILRELKGRLRENYLCLCPNHAAMFMHAREEGEFAFKQRLLSQTENEMTVRLAGEEREIFFAKKHLEDLKDVIRTVDAL